MKNSHNLLSILALTALLACNNTEPIHELTESNPEIVENLTLAKKPNSWINERVSKAKDKLNSTEAGQLLWQSMAAHGGLERWFDNGPIAFRFDYVPVGGNNAKRTFQQVDTWSNKAVHQSVEDENDMFGWDGNNAWTKRNDSSSFGFDVRFWALTPYYFLGQPFIFDGEGVILEKLDDITLDSIPYDAIKITFESGTGDAPDDYYINLYDKNTHVLKALKYIVSYPKRFEKGEHSPEKIMIITSYQEVGGITLAKTYETYSTNEKGEKDKLVTQVEVSDAYFNAVLDNSYFNMPPKADLVVY